MEKLVLLLTRVADYIVIDLLGFTTPTLLSNALHYFIIGFTEIITLVVLVTYLMGLVTSYLPMDKIRSFLERNQRLGFGNVLAALLGAITPFCSCSSIPLFVGMMQSRIPLGIALSFLITSPLVNEIAVVLFWASYGWKVTIIYVLTGILLGVVGGIVLEKVGMANYVADWIKNLSDSKASTDHNQISLKQRWKTIHSDAVQTIKKLVIYIFIGLAIGSFIHGYVPESFFETYISKSNPLAVPIAVLLAIPLYIDAVGVLPVIESLVSKGVPLGTAIAFMMASIGLSFPEALLLKKVMQKKLIVAFFTTIGIGMILSGFFFNLLF